MNDPGAASAPAPVWEHHTAAGIEYGAEQPTGRPLNAISALARSVSTAWRTRHLVWLLAVHDYKGTFRGQSLGMFWSIANPLVMMVTITIALTHILRVDIPNFPIFYLTGAVFWQYFSSTLSGCASSFRSKSALIGATNFPRFMVPAVPVVTSTINLGIEILLLYLFYFIFPESFAFTPALLFLPVIFALLMLLCIGAGLLTSSLNVRFRDITHIVSAVNIVGFWITPVIYSTTMAPNWAVPMLRLNPLAGVLEGARSCIMDGRLPTLSQMLPTIVGSVLIFLVGASVYRRESLRISDYI